MLYWKCENKECEDFGKEVLEVKPMFKYTPQGTVPINIPYCPKCGKQMGYREELPKKDGEPINISFAKFNSMSNEDKSIMLKKRYQDGIKKENIQEKIDNKRLEMTKKFFGQE